MMLPAQKQSVTGIILESLAASAYQVVGLQRSATITVIDGATAGGVDLLAPCGCGGHITPSTPITPGIAAIPLFWSREWHRDPLARWHILHKVTPLPISHKGEYNIAAS